MALKSIAVGDRIVLVCEASSQSVVGPLRTMDDHFYAREGMTVLEPGPGMGYFTLELARRGGTSLTSHLARIQRRIFERLKRRSEKAGLDRRIDARLAQPDSMALDELAGKVDFVSAAAMVYEIENPADFLKEIVEVVKAEGQILVMEPKGTSGKPNSQPSWMPPRWQD